MLSEIWIYKKNEKIFIVTLFLLLVVIGCLNWMLGLLTAIVIIGFVIVIEKNDYKQERILLNYLDELSAGVEAGTIYAVKNLPLGISLMDEKRQFVWANGVFRSWLKADIEEDNLFKDVFSGVRISKIWGKTGWFDYSLDEEYYRVFYKFIPPSKENGAAFMAFYLVNRTAMQQQIQACKEAMPVFGLIRVDNVAEATQNMTDVEKSNILSEVDEVILSEFISRDAFIKRYSSTEFVICMSRKALEDCMNDNFNILDKVRDIHTVNRIPVTISIGIVKCEGTFAKQFELAQTALDLALGRGGDQAIVRMDKDVKAFGGRSSTSVSSTRVRVRVVAQALREIIQESDRVFVMGHGHEDYDAIGAAVGVTHLAKASGKPVNIVLSAYEDTSHKMINALDADKEMGPMLMTEKTALNIITDKSVLFIVDTHVPQVVAAPELLRAAKKRVVIDHHRRNASIISPTLLTYMEPSASSASELVSELIQYYGGDRDLTTLEASCLYAGLVVDTKNFSVQTSVRTFDAASFLRRSGADAKLVRALFAVNVETVRIKSEIMAHLKTVDGYMVFAECPAGTEQAQIVAGQVADYLVTVEGIHASFLFYHVEEGVTSISARSDGTVNVQVVMEALGGGGHLTVSGAQISGDMTIEAATQKIVEEVRKQIKEA
ncbi:c-di-AMP phosphodiesterase, consists of a GGDEF-like and DHH domains [Dialister histaminiformans]|uniref:Cyclic-di-AMP phosphodiesterase n=1 Tax=Allisonella histaminiformans TaxID=209880 RepID=A0A1G5W4K6_9FIRM|nr:DHH family phosphoesterase [Allisonella histaminiformans]SDA52195.1 c-di-AMP phosphodiesterase, consists of a GGDEF-like and DHH domains [Allisonella histaminiformans]